MAEPNTAELVAIYQHIKAHPDEWNQRDWAVRNSCGTAFCFAGHASARAGAKPVWVPRADEADIADASLCTLPDGTERAIVSHAREVLGLWDHWHTSLFDGDNTLADLRRIITRITGVDPDPDGAQ